MRTSGAFYRRGAAHSPVIGITAALKEDSEQGIAGCPSGRFVRADHEYVDAVARAGGSPVVLAPTLGLRAAGALLDRLDGLLLSGGSDLDPGYYGEKPVPELGTTLPERDLFEMALLKLALPRRMPVFGICRGMQILNVALGGTLYQDLPSQLDRNTLSHDQEAPKWQPTHEVKVRQGSWLSEITGGRSIAANSYHHQGIKDLAADLFISARSADGVIEAVEARDLPRRWIVGVQWHPEGMRNTSPEHRNLFEAHVHAAECHALRRVAA